MSNEKPWNPMWILYWVWCFLAGLFFGNEEWFLGVVSATNATFVAWYCIHEHRNNDHSDS